MLFRWRWRVESVRYAVAACMRGAQARAVTTPIAWPAYSPADRSCPVSAATSPRWDSTLILAASMPTPSFAARPSNRVSPAAESWPSQSRPVPRFPSAIARAAGAAATGASPSETSASTSVAFSISVVMSPCARAIAMERRSLDTRIPPRTSGPASSRRASARSRCGLMSSNRPAWNSRAAAHSASSGRVTASCGGTRASTSSTAARSIESSSGKACVTSSRPSRTQSPASAACLSASSGRPCSMNHSAARLFRSATMPGSSSRSRCLSISRSRAW